MVKKARQATPNNLLRQARQERGWTQKDVADQIGAPLDLNVTRWERGTARPSAYYVQKLCELFGKSARELGLLPPELQAQETVTSSKSDQLERSEGIPVGMPLVGTLAKDLPTGTITLLFIDMAESTHLLQQLGDRYANVLAEYRQVVRTSVQQWNGHEVDAHADSFFVVFSLPSMRLKLL
jgi:transcriptional regulator with XRE-family HTH domain